MLNEVKLNKQDQDLISKLIYDKVGIVLNDKKKSLISGRLQKILRNRAVSSFKEYYDLVVNDRSGEALVELIDRMSTNHTFFFRENDHFELLKKSILPEIKQRNLKKGKKEIRIWSAASSSGEEIYTLKMVLNEFLGTGSDFRSMVLGTDISTKVLQEAVQGNYSSERISGISKTLLMKYFSKTMTGTFQVKEILKRDVLFKRLNLKMPRFPFKHKFNIIFCRNVMIYFDQPTKLEIVRKFAQVIEPGGYLFIGMSETIGQKNDYFEYIKPSVYVRNNYGS